MYDIGFSLQTQYDRPITQVVALLKQHGFSAVSPLWSPELDMAALADCVHENGMIIQSLHAPHKGLALLWKPDSAESVDIQKNVFQALDACEQYQIPILVLHGWQGLIYTFPETPLDFRFFDQLVARAKQKGVSIAFENLEGEEYLNALLTRYQDQMHVGFCWDSGHDNCYPHKTDFLQAYGDRLIMTHLNDNLGLRDPTGVPSGNDDLHFIPYDGNINWSHALRRLSTAPRQTILNFELKLRSKSESAADRLYVHLTLEQFLEAAASRARQIAKEYHNMMNQA